MAGCMSAGAGISPRRIKHFNAQAASYESEETCGEPRGQRQGGRNSGSINGNPAQGLSPPYLISMLDKILLYLPYRTRYLEAFLSDVSILCRYYLRDVRTTNGPYSSKLGADVFFDPPPTHWGGLDLKISKKSSRACSVEHGGAGGRPAGLVVGAPSGGKGHLAFGSPP